MSDDEMYEPVPLGFGIEAAPPSYKAAISKKNESIFKVIRLSARTHKWGRGHTHTCTCCIMYTIYSVVLHSNLHRLILGILVVICVYTCGCVHTR